MKEVKKPRIGAVIPTYNRKDSLRKCLLCLRRQEGEGDEYTLVPIVVVDGSSDGTIEMIRDEFPGTELVQGNGNWWYTKSINEGFKRAEAIRCDFVLTLNDDLEFKEDYLHTILADYSGLDAGAIVGSVSLSQSEPRLITFSGVERINFFLKEYNYLPKFSLVAEQELSGLRPSVVLSGRGILYPAAILRKWGFYDERLVQYSSETDYTYRASRNSVNVVISYNAKVYENVGLTSAGAVYNRPGIGSLVGSFANRHSINSWRKIFYYSTKHRGIIAGIFIAVVRIMGIVKNFIVVKFREPK